MKIFRAGTGNGTVKAGKGGRGVRERGQGFIEYFLLILLAFLVAFSFWSALGGGPAEVWSVLRRTVWDWLARAGLLR